MNMRFWPCTRHVGVDASRNDEIMWNEEIESGGMFV